MDIDVDRRWVVARKSDEHRPYLRICKFAARTKLTKGLFGTGNSAPRRHVGPISPTWGKLAPWGNGDTRRTHLRAPKKEVCFDIMDSSRAMLLSHGK